MSGRSGRTDRSQEEDSSEEDDSDEEFDAATKKKLVKKLDMELMPITSIITNHAVHKYFRKLAQRRRPDGRRGIGVEEVDEMSENVAKKLGLPATIFRLMPTVVERFDFDGCGLLNKTQCTTMFRSVLKQRRQELGGRTKEVAVPEAKLSDKGYEVIKELGRGGQGIMYLATCKGSKRKYCVKFYSKENPNADDVEDIIEEYALMKELSNKHIAKTYEVFQDDTHFYLVNEPYFGGDLTKLPKRAHEQGQSMRECWWRGIFRQCLDGLNYLHSQAIMHCDIKEPNVMIASDGSYEEPRAVLIDFGLICGFSASSCGASGTPGYIPPETYESGYWYPRGDVFSMGITFFQIMVGRVPRDDNSILGVLQVPGDTEKSATAARELALPWARFPHAMVDLQDLVSKMTSRDKQERPLPAQALDHRWFKSRSDAPLPEENLHWLLGTAAFHDAHAEVHAQLAEVNNLAELRNLQAAFKAADPNGEGRVAPDAAVQIFRDYGAYSATSQKFIDAHAGVDGQDQVHYDKVVRDVINAKVEYNDHFVQNLFAELDADKSGSLSKRELKSLLHSSAFECSADSVDDLLANMDTNHDGTISFAEFRRAVLEDGQIARRSIVEKEARNRFCGMC